MQDLDILPVFLGRGKNGKTALAGALEGVLGLTSEHGYAASVPPKVLYGKEDLGDTGCLLTARVAICPEINQKVDNEVLKRLTGSDVINARRLQHDNVPFRPRYKLLLLANKLCFRSDALDDDAFERRLVVYPFSVKYHATEEGRQAALSKPGAVKEHHALAKAGIKAWLRDNPQKVLKWVLPFIAEVIKLGKMPEPCPAMRWEIDRVLGRRRDAWDTFFYEHYQIDLEQAGFKPWWLPSPDLHDHVDAYCHAAGIDRFTDELVEERMKGAGVTRERKLHDSKTQRWCYCGVRRITPVLEPEAARRADLQEARKAKAAKAVATRRANKAAKSGDSSCGSSNA
jgi:hypothetical protein